MKKRILAGLAAVLFIAPAFAQTSHPIATHSVAVMAAGGRAAPAYVDQNGLSVRAKVAAAFAHLFTASDNVKWHFSNKQYLASFTQNGQPCQALFGVGGGWLYSLKYGTEKDLPRDVYRDLKSSYVDYTISVVTEVTAPQGHAWIVTLTDKDNLVVARAVDGQVEEVQRYNTH